VLRRVAHAVDTLARPEGFDLDLLGKDCQFFIVEQREQRDLPEDVGVARHWI
jgi:hypothetical protein